MSLRRTLVFLTVALVVRCGVAQTTPPSVPFTPPSVTQLDPKIEARIATLLAQMTLEEKIGLIGGPSYMNTQAIPRLGIPSLKFSDGPVGVRCWGKSTAYPACSLLAATWDPAAALAMGRAIGRDARARGVHLVLGPATNIYREAQNGRNFEYVGEDPYLASVMAVNYIQGMQSQGVAACIKHFAANEQETQRGSVDTIVSRRALEEIYFPPFKAAIEEGNVWTAMAAYNKVNGEYCTASSFLLTDILDDQWNFKGVLMSDWGAAHDTLKDLKAGMDLEMSILPRFIYNLKSIHPLLDSGQIAQAALDDHVRRMLRLIIAMGFLDRDQTDSSIPLDDPENAATALKISSEGIVLLKNEKNFLPLDRTQIHRILVLGPNADAAVICGGGSSGVDPFSKVSVLQGLKTVAGDSVQIDSLPDSQAMLYAQSIFAPANPSEGQQGMSAEYFDNPDLKGQPLARRVDRVIDFNWGENSPLPGIPGASSFSARWRGTITPGKSGNYLFSSSSDDGSRVFLDGTKIIDIWGNHPTVSRQAVVALEKDHVYHLKVEYYNNTGGAEMHFGWALPAFSSAEKSQISSADVVVFAGGFNGDSEHEGDDRSWELPTVQTDELSRIAALNPHLIVSINAGGNVGLGDNLDHIPALLWSWYPGQNGNLALAKIIFGDINPSGHLPDTFEKKFEDAPAFGNFPGDPANGGTVHLDEGVYVGYRWFDKKNIEPAFPFGFGLSYSTFDLKDVHVKTEGQGDDRRFTVSVQITNTGSRDGDAVVQLYVRPVNSSIDRPMQELKGFVRVTLKAGETQTVTLPLTRKDFATYDETSSSWIVPPGAYQLVLGHSSRDIAQIAQITW
jgi:beta-glucosidase